MSGKRIVEDLTPKMNFSNGGFLMQYVLIKIAVQRADSELASVFLVLMSSPFVLIDYTNSKIQYSGPWFELEVENTQIQIQ